MKKIIFKGLPPNDNVVYNNQILKNGAVAEMSAAEADAYIGLKWAFEVVDANETELFQEQQVRVNKTRKKIMDESVVR